MDLTALRIFLTVAEERSFSRAAAKVHRTQPAVSQAVKRLEEELGEQLFAKFLLQSLYRLADSGLSAMDFCGRARKAALFSDREEDPQGGQIHKYRLS